VGIDKIVEGQLVALNELQCADGCHQLGTGCYPYDYAQLERFGVFRLRGRVAAYLRTVEVESWNLCW
jgi:hypothetical protein